MEAKSPPPSQGEYRQKSKSKGVVPGGEQVVTRKQQQAIQDKSVIKYEINYVVWGFWKEQVKNLDGCN